ncbi:lyase family protein [Paenibacillus chibensis]|uniref:lyase family protein n=1 Tax=Paenibacillus chibensis TaxID=59846 RepID=UPI0013E37401|nr:lyase family protein [Paenibacillus chibensis]MEC0371576.1 lyase family protein [Paenibacillus chibensis]
MTRIEQDRPGARKVPSHAYYGIQTLLAAEKLPVAGIPVHEEWIAALANVKQAAAQAHVDLGTLPLTIGRCVIKAAEEIRTGKHLQEFILDGIQAGIHDALNTNMNEVIANRALEFMLEGKGSYEIIHPEKHVNLSQNAHGLMSVSFRIAAHSLSQELIRSTDRLISCLLDYEKTMDKLHSPSSPAPTPGTIPWLGRQFGNSARNLLRDMKEMVKASSRLQTVDLSDALISNEPSGEAEFIKTAAAYLTKQTKLDILTKNNVMDSHGSHEAPLDLSTAVLNCALVISKIGSDARLAAAVLSQDDTTDQALSIRAISESAAMLAQIAFQAAGLNHSIRLAAEFGMADQDGMPSLMALNLLESMKLLIKGMESFTLMLKMDAEQRILYR